MENNDLHKKYLQFFTDEVAEEDEVKEVVANPVTKSQRKAIMSEEAFDEFFKEIYEDLNK